MEGILGNIDILVVEDLVNGNEKIWFMNIVVFWELMDKSFKRGVVDGVKRMYEKQSFQDKRNNSQKLKI